MRPIRPSVVVLAAALSAACGGAGAPPEAAAPPPAERKADGVPVAEADLAAAGITTAAVRRVERADPLQAAGVVALNERRTARIGSLVEGVVEELPFQVGDVVRQGTVLAHIHSHAVHDAWADYFKALSVRRRLDSELSYATTAEFRAAKLVADKALSPQELERARADREAIRQEIVAADADITRMDQELGHYGLKADPLADPHEHEAVPISTPFGGVVIERQTAQGAAVTVGTPLMVVSDLSQVWVLAEIDEAMVGRVRAGSQVTIRSAAYPGETFPGRLEAVGDVVNPQTRRVTLRVGANNPGRRLKPQMYVTVELASAAPRPVLVVPTRAVQAMEGETVVFVRGTAGMFTRRAVVTGRDLNGEVEIVSGIAEGDVVATAGAFLLKSELLAPSGEEP